MEQKTDILIFDVGLGQSIFIYPHSSPEYGMLVDCGHEEGFHPIDFLIKHDYIHNNKLGNLTITNYDQDHFSGIGNLIDKVNIWTASFCNNLTSSEIKVLKEEVTDQLDNICNLKDTYIHPVPNFIPPFTKKIFFLEKHELKEYDTNNLSQVVFIEHNGSVVCVSGDLEEGGWLALLTKYPEMKEWLRKTNIYIASHHGRENGYCKDVFYCCSPECVIISDKGIVHNTQKDTVSLYGSHVFGGGINLNSRTRKVLTTRDDGHIFIELYPNSSRIYSNFYHE